MDERLPTISERSRTSFNERSIICSPFFARPVAVVAVSAMEVVFRAISIMVLDICSEAVAIWVALVACLPTPVDMVSELAFISPLAAVTLSAATSTSATISLSFSTMSLIAFDRSASSSLLLISGISTSRSPSATFLTALVSNRRGFVILFDTRKMTMTATISVMTTVPDIVFLIWARLDFPERSSE